ncbi:universal stress protein [Natrinema salaciae]|uniref:Nucleotide-binding universal stress protein, UspA family n=1 Tax=Natrinema salaciae TaxID=1186196 RepID=A0A1H9SN09_9EURY|nr:universal stress protein [Natrinema salaciae]SER86410.1 Nucleotide-binding universal stress protein, UspA family [Natrinema salaciae]
MVRTVLVPVDGSPLSSRALRYALREFPDAELTAYHVIDLFEPDYADQAVASMYEPMLGSDEWYRFVGEVRDRRFTEVDEIAADYDRSVATDSDIGDPKRLVLEYATDEDVDQIVLGAHGRSDTKRAVYGSVAERVVRRAPVPVTVVR